MRTESEKKSQKHELYDKRCGYGWGGRRWNLKAQMSQQVYDKAMNRTPRAVHFVARGTASHLCVYSLPSSFLHLFIIHPLNRQIQCAQCAL